MLAKAVLSLKLAVYEICYNDFSFESARLNDMTCCVHTGSKDKDTSVFPQIHSHLCHLYGPTISSPTHLISELKDVAHTTLIFVLSPYRRQLQLDRIN